ncbi:hypothetical protein BJY04DRAFT_218506 [Aspergillus karnatakaensis]|uniref:uncharacterized protein n=1 Tax=Aspergillus karnatakaensis TaxID=1810916 RepID=UPI003CCD238B
MDVSDASPAAVTKPHVDEPVGPVDILFDARDYALVDKKAPQIVEAENQKLDDLMGQFTKGFDPGAFGGVILASLPNLAENLFPGSYAHLLLLLFSSFEMLQNVQLSLEYWMGHQYHGTPNIAPNATSGIDENYFGAEMEMLRKLLEPIREGTKKSIFWLNTRRADPVRACEQLEAAVRVIESFKDDVFAAMSSFHENKTMYCSLPVSLQRTAMTSMKQLRLDTCMKTLHWDSFSGTEIELTSFYRFYKAHISKTEPDRARAAGWLPPISPKTPRLSAPEAGEGDLASWPSPGVKNTVLDLLLKTALWLSVARGLPAVHLFCDVARLFVMNQPPRPGTDEHQRFMLHLIRFRGSTGGAQFSPSLVIPREGSFPNRNTDYFEDVWRTSHNLQTRLYEDTSLHVQHNVPNFKLATAPSGRRRSALRDIQIITNLPARASPASTPCTPENDFNHSSDDDLLPSFSRDSPTIYRNRTV